MYWIIIVSCQYMYDRWFFFLLFNRKILWSLHRFYGSSSHWKSYFVLVFELLVPIFFLFMRFIYYSFRLLFRFRKHFLIQFIFVTTQFLDCCFSFVLYLSKSVLWFMLEVFSKEFIFFLPCSSKWIRWIFDGNEVKYFRFCQIRTVIGTEKVLLFLFIYYAIIRTYFS